MKSWLIVCLVIVMGSTGMVEAQGSALGLSFGPSFVLESGTGAGDFSAQDWFKKRKKRRRKNTFAVGLVAGGPVGFGARGVFRLDRIGVAADVAYNRIRDDDGDMVNAFAMKADFRLYSKGILAKLVRPYTFIGVTTQRGRFDEGMAQSVYLMDGGIGAGVKLWRLEIGAEAGVLIPFRQLDTYRPGLGAFVNANILLWLI